MPKFQFADGKTRKILRAKLPFYSAFDKTCKQKVVTRGKCSELRSFETRLTSNTKNFAQNPTLSPIRHSKNTYSHSRSNLRQSCDILKHNSQVVDAAACSQELNGTPQKGPQTISSIRSKTPEACVWNEPNPDFGSNADFHGKLQELASFYRESGHSFVSKVDGIKLSKWCSTIRRARKEGALSQARISALEGVGFEWDQREANNFSKFRRDLECFCADVKANGYCTLQENQIWFENQKLNIVLGNYFGPKLNTLKHCQEFKHMVFRERLGPQTLDMQMQSSLTTFLRQGTQKYEELRDWDSLYVFEIDRSEVNGNLCEVQLDKEDCRSDLLTDYFKSTFHAQEECEWHDEVSEDIERYFA